MPEMTLTAARAINLTAVRGNSADQQEAGCYK